ncbi:MAG TPA: type I phosphomannose isomerase catalytic subunit [Thermomicrobiales bacterium]|nr:type I phosphomannose isomerase catalytic subunit [Thermomicrobiales bacterium]
MAGAAEETQAGGVSVVEPRLDAKPWGGRRLERYGFDLPRGETIGEALVTAGEAMITAGAGTGRSLADIVRTDPEGALGAVAREAVRGRAIFPLLVKLIDAQENLSIQVHPNDEQAASRDRLGKTEAWHVLTAEPGSSLYLGLQQGVSLEELQAAAQRLDGASAALLRKVPAVPNTTVLIPAGTVHALGAGVMVYEIQQPSDVTFRMDDWGRVDAQGNPREMHLDEGFVVMNPTLRPELIDPVDLAAREGRRHMLVACRHFALERVALPGGGRYTMPGHASSQVVTVLEGAATVGSERLGAGQSAVMWPGRMETVLEAVRPMVALRGWVPDLAADFPVLTRRAAIDVSTLATLSGLLPDVRAALELQ